MKKFALLILLSCIGFISCKKESKQEVITETEIAPIYYVDANTSNVNWTAYKTTKKVAVNGIFSRINIKNPIESETKHGALNNLNFSIPVSSFFSKNEIRDDKIKKLFFGMMEDTSLVTGFYSDIKGNENTGSLILNLKMNSEIVAVPMEYTITKNTIALKGTLANLMDWKMTEAFASLHKACETLHTGEDGISKTWTDVAISATAVLKTK